MARLLAALLAAVSLFASAAAAAQDPYATVRPIARGLQTMCSAVVVAPGRALTAQHCIMDGEATHVDGLPITGAKYADGQDLALIEAPGLACPCAVVDKRLPPKDATARVIGFPRGVKEQLDVRVYGTGDMSIAFGPNWPDSGTRHLFTSPGIRPGYSGGGTFVQRNGKWKLVAINSIMLTMFGFPIAGGSEPLDRTDII